MSRPGDLNNLFTGGLSTAGMIVLFAVVTPIYFAIKYWYATLAIVLVALFLWGVAWAVIKIGDPSAAKASRRADIIRRADEQHVQVMQGDERGFYGQFPPADLT